MITTKKDSPLAKFLIFIYIIMHATLSQATDGLSATLAHISQCLQIAQNHATNIPIQTPGTKVTAYFDNFSVYSQALGYTQQNYVIGVYYGETRSGGGFQVCTGTYPAIDGPGAEVSSFSSSLISGTKQAICAKGSIIDVSRKLVSEQIGIAKTPFYLNYSSDYNDSRLARRTIPINFQFANTSDYPYYVQIIAGGQVLKTIDFPIASPIIQSAWTWDGTTNAIQQTPYFKTIEALVSVTEKFDYSLNGSNYVAYIPVTSKLKKLSLYNPSAWGLGGWTLNDHHYFDRSSKTIFWGTGTSTEIKSFKTMTLAPYGSVDLVISNDGTEVYVFNAYGKHLETKTALMGVTKYKFSYSADDKLVNIQDRDGKFTVFNRDTNGNLISIQAPFGQITQIALDPNARILTATSPGGGAHLMSYDTRGFLSVITKPDGLQTQFTYDNQGNFVREEKNNGFFQSLSDAISGTFRTVTHDISSSAQKTYEIAEYKDHETLITKDGLGRILEQRDDYDIRYTNSSLGENTVVYTQNDPIWGNALVTPSNIQTVYSENGSTVQQTTYSSKTVSLANTANPFSITSMTQVFHPGLANFIDTYDSVTRTITQRDSTGLTQTSYFDEKERLIRLTDSNGFNDIYIDYNNDGLVTKYTNKNQITQFTYTVDGEVASITRLDAINPLPIQFVRNAAGEITQKILRNGDVIKYEYTTSGAIKKVTTPSGTEHIFLTSLGDILTEAIAPAVSFFSSQTSTKYEYDLARRIQKITQPSGKTLTYSYQTGTNFLESITTQTGAYQFINIDPRGRYQTTNSPDNIQTKYKWLGPMTKEEQWLDSDGSIIGTLNYEFQDQSLLLSRILLNGTEVTKNQYDTANRPVSISQGKYTYSYSNSGGVRTISEANANGTVSANYKITSQASSEFQITVAALGGDKLSINFSKDHQGDYSQTSGASRLTYKLINGVQQSLDSSEVDSYSYDANERLTQASKIINGQTQSITYELPPASNGNIISFTGGGPTNSNRTIASYDAQDRLTKLTGSINRDYNYSVDGHLQSMTNCYGTTKYEYDEFSNLKKVVLPGGKTIEYKVDAFNRRVKKMVNGITTEYYLWYDQTRIAAILDQNKMPKITYLYGPISFAPTQMIKAGVAYRIVVDPDLGSVRYVIDTSNARIFQEISYDAYGNMTKNTAPDFQPLAFAGGLFDSDTKLIKFGARDYDPTVGRWTTKDPIGFAGGDTNLYGYVANDPVNGIDPSGLSRLVYDGRSGQLLVYPGNDGTYGPPQSFPAGNNTIRPNGDPLTPDSFGPAPNGTFGVGPFTPKSGGPNGSYGSGIFHFHIPQRPGIGLHAGRENLGGPNYNTKGCIRTTESALDALRSDPPTAITIGH